MLNHNNIVMTKDTQTDIKHITEEVNQIKTEDREQIIAKFVADFWSVTVEKYFVLWYNQVRKTNHRGYKMINYGLKDKVALITGTNNPWGIGAAMAKAFASEGAKLVLVYKKIDRPYDKTKTDRNGVDRYYAANAGDASVLEVEL